MRRWLLFVPGLVVGAAGVGLGAVPTAVEPAGQFVSCGPVLFHGAVLPDPACAAAYQPLQAVAVVLLVLAVLLLILAGVYLARRRPSAMAATDLASDPAKPVHHVPS